MAFYMNEAALADLWGKVAKIRNSVWQYCWDRHEIKKVLTKDAAALRVIATRGGSPNYEYSISYSDEIAFDAAGEIALKNPKTASYYMYDTSVGDAVVNKYFEVDGNGVIYFAGDSPDATYSNVSTTYHMSINCSLVSYEKALLRREYIFSEDAEHKSDGAIEEIVEIENGITAVEYYFLGSVALNALAYYKNNPDEVWAVMAEAISEGVNEV